MVPSGGACTCTAPAAVAVITHAIIRCDWFPAVRDGVGPEQYHLADAGWIRALHRERGPH